MTMPRQSLKLFIALTTALIAATTMAQKKPMSCKLKSEKVVQGREKKCLYVCEDKSLEGRLRKIDSSCPKYITSAQ